MNDLIRAELLKLRTLRTFWWMVAATIATVPLGVALAVSGGNGAGKADLHTTVGFRNVFATGSWGSVVVILLGILVMTGEFRFNTATSTFLITPDRRRVVAAKLAAVSLTGAAIGVLSSLVTLAVAVPWLSAKDIPIASRTSDIVVVLLGATVATALGGLLGAGIGAASRNQTVAITAYFVWVFVVEGLLVQYKPEIGRWLPGGAAGALSGVETANGHLLPMWGAALLLGAYALTFSAAADRFVVRRDIA